MAVRRIITNRAKKSIRNLYWRSTRKSIQRNQETKSLVDAMVELVDVTPLSPSSESRGVLGVWKNKGYTIFESTHCFVRYLENFADLVRWQLQKVDPHIGAV